MVPFALIRVTGDSVSEAAKERPSVSPSVEIPIVKRSEALPYLALDQ
jgi:hypothetical protein